MYIILPFNFSNFHGKVLITNDLGEFVLLSELEFDGYINLQLDTNSELYFDLKSKYFLCYQEDLDSVIRIMGVRLRTKKAFLQCFTVLHMIVPTIACNSKCIYCQASSKDEKQTSFSMSKQVIKKAINLMIQSPSKHIKIEIQGGEPLLRFDLVKLILCYTFTKSLIEGKTIDYVICTNLTLMTEAMLKYLKRYNVHISTSLDGPKYLHDSNRPLRNGQSSFDLFYENLEVTRDILGYNQVSCLLTVTKKSLPYYKEIIDQYISLGFNSIFIRMLNPYGLAITNTDIVGYSIDEFIEFYINAIDYIINLNIHGIQFKEEYASIVLKKILTPFSTGFVDLQSPSGLGISCAFYNHDGIVYASDEGRMLGEMGIDQFVIGDVQKDNYHSIFNSDKLRTIIKESIAETSPICSACVFLPYCGCDPIRNWQEDNSYMRKSLENSFCKKNKKLIEIVLQRLLFSDEQTKGILQSWVS